MRESEQPSWETFLAWPASEVARRMRQDGPKVCVFPINGTRRWAWLEHGEVLRTAPDTFAAYMDIAERAYVRLFGMLFEHGVDTVLSPLFGDELLGRGEAYVRAVLEGVRRFAESPTFTDFYRAFGVRVRYYGDFRRKLAHFSVADLLDSIDKVTRDTAQNAPCRLLLGLFADDPWEQIGEIIVEHYRHHGAPPSHAELVRAYYGEDVPPVTLFLGFDRPAVYDYPLLASGQEDLYFTYAPSPYLEEGALRAILYDHLYTRRIPEPDWSALDDHVVETLRTYYHGVLKRVQGVGRVLAYVWVAKD